MTNCNKRLSSSSIVILALLGGCTLVPEPETVADSRLDQLVLKVDQSLSNQAMVNAQLQEQWRQLDLQQQHLQLLSQDLGRVLEKPVETSCPEAVVCPALKKIFSKMVVGALEEIWLSDLEIALTARIDTGAQTSSLDARNIELFERDGKRWVRFEIVNPRTNEPEPVERKSCTRVRCSEFLVHQHARDTAESSTAHILGQLEAGKTDLCECASRLGVNRTICFGATHPRRQYVLSESTCRFGDQ